MLRPMIALLLVWLAAWRSSSAHSAWKGWRGTLAKLRGLRRGFYASARRAAGWLLVLAVVVG